MSAENKDRNLWLWATAFLCIPILAPPIMAGDYFWHVLTGQVILEQGGLPSTDIFQAVSDARPWGTFQWLYEVLLAFGEPRIGFTGIRLVHGLFGALFLLLWVRAISSYLRWGREATILLLGVLLFFYADRVRIRPHVFTFLIIGVWLPYLLDPKRIKGGTVILVLAGMAGVLANLHAGGALILLSLALASFVGFSLQSQSVRRWAPWGLLLGAFVLCALMPGFLKGLFHATRMAEANTQLFLEWQAPAIYFEQPAGGFIESMHHWLLGSLPYLLTTLYAGLALWVLVRRKVSGFRSIQELPAIALAGGALLLSLRSVRFVPFLILAIPGLLALVQYFYRDWRSRPIAWRPHRRLNLALAVFLVVCSHVYLLRAYRGADEGPVGALQRWVREDVPERHFPKDLADFIEEKKISGGIYNVNTKWGSYLLWRHWPDLRVHYDGRGNLGTVPGCTGEEGLPCTEAGRIAFVQRHRGNPAYRDACLKIFLDATDQPGVSHLLIPAPTFASVYPRKSADEPERPWPAPVEFRRIYPEEGKEAPPGSPELWLRLKRN
jgi:hypothetical protein